jgi:hypothetical protein
VVVISKGGNSRTRSGALQLTGSDLVTEARERSCSGGRLAVTRFHATNALASMLGPVPVTRPKPL